MKIAIVTLSDSGYFHLLEELIDSIHSFHESSSVSICVLDAGMTEEQLKKIENKVHSIQKAKWDIPVSSSKVKGKEWLKSQVSRAFLPNYFPSFQKYIWIDCDAWIQSWFVINLLKKACNDGKLGIVSMSDRHNGRVARVDWFFKSLGFVKSQNYKHAKSSGFSEKICRKIAMEPHLNIGVFSLELSSPVWKIWQKNLEKSLSKGNIFGSEQLAINMSAYIDGIATDILPFYCNWIPHPQSGNTKFDLISNKFVEGFTPHGEIGIIHLAGGVKIDKKDMRLDSSLKVAIPTLCGKTIERNFRYQRSVL
jgi:hypothetical protein